jgi:PucR C-terminal helix-turn-helix domain
LAAPVVTEHETLAGIVERVDFGAVAGDMVAAFRTEIPGYGRLPTAILAERITSIVRGNLELFVRTVLEQREPTEEDLSPFRESTKERAAEGMPLEDLLHAYRLGGRMAWNVLVKTALPDERYALLDAAELIMGYVDRVSSAVAQSYLEQHQQLASEEERRLRALFEALVDGSPIDSGLREIAVPGAPAWEHSQVAASLRLRNILAVTEGERVSGLAGATVPNHALGNGRTLLAAAEPTPQSDLAIVLEETRFLVELGREHGLKGELKAEEFLPELLLARSSRLADAVRRRVIGPLEDYAERRESDLIGTLETFVASGLDRRGTADRMHVHPNTLDYRLRRIQELTGLDLRRPGDLALVTLALKERAMRKASAESAG